MKKFFILLFGLIIAILIGGCLNLGIFLPFLNRAPVIISEPIITATEDHLYSYQVEVNDPEGDTLVYFLTLKPEGMRINGEDGLITWTPTNNQVGIHQVIVETSDGKYSVQQNFKIEVANVNDPPQILSYLPTNLSFEINEGDSIKFEVQAEDVDLNTILNYKWCLDGKIVSNSTGAGTSTDSMSSWQYFFKYEDYGLKIIKVLVNDGELEDSVQWKVTVKDIAPPGKPTLNNITSPTNISPQILSGTKETNTSIWINGVKAIPIDTYTDWSYSFDLIEGENNISITSRDAAGNESTTINTNITLDTIPSITPTLNSVISPTNISAQILCGSKETNSSIWINGIEIIPSNPSTEWSYSFDLTEGDNNISITSHDDADNESSEVVVNIILDTIAPTVPSLDPVTSPTNISSQILSGTKETNTSIWINGVEAVPINSDTTWSYTFNLSEGNNNILITSRDAAGNESFAINTDIILDTIMPEAPTLNSVTSPTNISPQILSGTKETNTSIWINGVKAIPIDTYTDWSYSLDLIEGENNISVTSRDSAGNESSPVTAIIEYDLNTYVDAGNTSGIEDGTRTYPFNTISEGLKAAVEGKSVVVSGGTYNEQLVINKGITLQGAGKENTFITGTGFNGNLITCEADNITISGFTIDGGNSTIVGIYLNGYSSININNSLIKNNNDYGISYSNSAPTIEDNNIEINAYSGIEVGSRGSGIIRNNSITSNQYGIRTCGDSSPEITHNNISNNSHTGIYCRESSTPVISYNTISDNGYGILIDNVLGNSVNPDIGGGEGGSVGKNNITGNQTHGVSNKTSHNIIAKNNWWGDNAGPKYPGNPNNATITSDWAYWSKTGGDIIFDPYLTEPQGL